jgi:glycosyltransferase involved in cell wall biosynthesis
MAAEKPVVSTAVPDTVALYGRLIRVGGDTPQFIALCRAALAETARQRSMRGAAMRAAVARASWDRTADRMRALLDEVAVGASAVPRGVQAVLWQND